MNIQFSKMHGLGNDFMVVDAVSQNIQLSTRQIQGLANRHRGIGFDQLLIIYPPKDSSHDFFYRIFNADGSEAFQCGNGARCISKYIYDHKLSDKAELTVATQKNKHKLILKNSNTITVDMGTPILEPQEIPFQAEAKKTIYTLTIKYGDYNVCVVSMGNPHCIFEVDNVSHIDLEQLGKTFSEHPQFPDRTNVEFMQIISKDHIRLRIYERGVGETEACGSGACAAVVAGILQNKLASMVTVTMPGGDLAVEWNGNNEPVWMTGPAANVFEGTIKL
jgi:diaminopimelate epimerase